MRKHWVLALIIGAVSCHAWAQDGMEKVMEKRAREMHRVIAVNDKEQWKKFVKENYAQSLIDRPMQEKLSTSENGNVTSSTTETQAANNLDAKTKMFERLHNDFGDSKIVSIKPTGEKLVMSVRADSGLSASFQLKFQKTSPYLIEGLGIEVVGE